MGDCCKSGETCAVEPCHWAPRLAPADATEDVRRECCGLDCKDCVEDLTERAKAVLDKNRVMLDVHTLSVDCACEPERTDYRPPEAPEGYEWVLMPARPFGGQAGGRAPGETGHYSDLNPEPIQVSEAWGLDGLEHSALKYLARYKKKNGVEDLKKVKFYADRLIAREIREGRA